MQPELSPMPDEQLDDDAEVLIDRHGPWTYTEYGVLCICGDAMDKNEDCAALRVLAKRDRLRAELAAKEAECERLRAIQEQWRAALEGIADGTVMALPMAVAFAKVALRWEPTAAREERSLPVAA